ncbi:MAG: hypothetical protein ACJ75G_04150 [Gaiellaceae bacterium]
MAQLRSEMESGEPPEGMPPAEVMLLHNPDADQALAIVLFENEDDYRKGDEILGSMPVSDTPGRRTGVTKYQVAMRMTP